jgi:hypothetical protein
MKIIGAYGVIDMSPIEMSEQLRALNLSHTYLARAGFRLMQYNIDGLCKEQPVWPIVVDSIRTLSKLDQWLQAPPARAVVFVADARAALTNTNISHALWPENRQGGFQKALKSELKLAHRAGASWQLEITNPSIMDYVNTAVKPSILNDLQSAFYKISNYTARKEIQKLCIGWFAGQVSTARIHKALKSNIRYERIHELMQSPLALALQLAVKELIATGEDAAVIAKRTGFESFELMYLKRSSEGNPEKETKAKGARK